MRALEGLGPFAACVCLYTAFGYFDDEQNAAVLSGIADVLEPGGKLVLDVTNPLALLPDWPSERPNRDWDAFAGWVADDVRRYSGATPDLTVETRADWLRDLIPLFAEFPDKPEYRGNLASTRC